MHRSARIIRFTALAAAMLVVTAVAVFSIHVFATPQQTFASGSAGRLWPWNIPARDASYPIAGFTDSSNNFVVVSDKISLSAPNNHLFCIQSFKESGERHNAASCSSTGSNNGPTIYGTVRSGGGAFVLFRQNSFMHMWKFTNGLQWQQTDSDFSYGSAAESSDGDGLFALGKGADNGTYFEWNVYGVKMRADGTAAWNRGWTTTSPAGTAIMPGIPGQVVAGNSGNAFFISTHQRASDGFNDGYYIQQISNTGVEQWGADGMLYIDAASASVSPGRGITGIDGLPVYAISYGNDTYLQKFDAAGNRLWGERGLLVAAGEFALGTQITLEPTSGDIIVSWIDGSEFYAQRYSPFGVAQWGSPLQLSTTAYDFAGVGPRSSFKVVPDGQGGILAAWASDWGASTGTLRAQRVDTTGSILWDPNGFQVGKQTSVYTTLASAGSGEAFVGWRSDTPSDDIYAQRIGSASTLPAEACSDGLYGHTVDYKRSTNDELVAGAWGWSFGGGSVTGTDATRAVWISRDADRFIVGGQSGWQVRTGAGATLATGTDDTYSVHLSNDGTRYMIGGKNGWKYGNADTGAVLRQGAQHAYAVRIDPGGLYLVYGGKNGWQELNTSTGAVVASGAQEIQSIAEEDASGFLLGGPTGAWYVLGASATQYSTKATRTVAGDPNATASQWRAGADGISDGFGAQFMSGASVATLSKCQSACSGLLRNWIGRAVFGGMWGWGWIATDGTLQWTGDTRMTAATEWRSNSDYLIYGGDWGWEVKWDEAMDTVVKNGTDNVVSCLGQQQILPPDPPPPPPDSAFSGAKRLSVYEGIVWIVGGAPQYDVMKLGEAGRDITSSGRLYFAADGVEAGAAYVAGQEGAAAQRLSLDSGTSPFPALELHSSNQPALSVTQDNASGRAALFLGNVYVSGQLRVINGGTKSSIVQTPGGERKLYASEALDERFTDYGTATLKDGTVTITLDPVFAETLSQTTEYSVLLTAIDTPTHLSVVAQTPGSFTVQGEQDVSFSYEITGLRREQTEGGTP